MAIKRIQKIQDIIIFECDMCKKQMETGSSEVNLIYNNKNYRHLCKKCWLKEISLCVHEKFKLWNNDDDCIYLICKECEVEKRIWLEKIFEDEDIMDIINSKINKGKYD